VTLFPGPRKNTWRQGKIRNAALIELLSNGGKVNMEGMHFWLHDTAIPSKVIHILSFLL
jgi:hypothetical protein